MKNLIKVFAIASLSFVFVQCASTNGNSSQYPTNSSNGGVVYRAPDGGIFKQGEIYRDNDGNVYQNGRVIRTGDIIGVRGVIDIKGVILYPGNNPRNLPPGQAKKIYGGSATDYAPGQVKKGNNYNDNNNNGKSKKDKKNKGKNNK